MLAFVLLGVIASFGAAAAALLFGLPVWLAVLAYSATGSMILLGLVGYVALREKLLTSSSDDDSFEFGMQSTQS